MGFLSIETVWPEVALYRLDDLFRKAAWPDVKLRRVPTAELSRATVITRLSDVNRLCRPKLLIRGAPSVPFRRVLLAGVVT